MREALVRLIDGFVPPDADRETARQYRVITAFVLSGALIVALVGVLNAQNQEMVRTLPILGVSAVFLATLAWLRRGGSPRPAVHVILGVALTVTVYQGYHPSGIDSEAMGWLIVGATGSVVLARGRDAAGWVALFMAANLVASPAFPHAPGYASESWVDAADRALACLLAALLAHHAESARRQATTELEAEVRHTERARQELALALDTVRSAQDFALRAHRLRAIGRLAAGVAHEVNTPAQYAQDNVQFLGGAAERLHGAAALALRALDDPARIPEARAALVALDLPALGNDVADGARDASAGIRRIGDIVDALTTFADPEPRRPTPVDVNHQVRLTVDAMHGVFTPIAVELALAEDLPPVPGWAGDLRQALMNVLLNAVTAIRDAPREPGRITIRTWREPAHVALEVADDGVGMGPEVLEQAFDPFFTTRSVGEGMGTGLSFAWRVVVDEHGGRLEARSTPGHGTALQIRLPTSDTLPAD